MEAHEAFERFEKTEHAAHEVGFAAQAALLVAVMAAFLAVATFKANEAVKDAIQTQTKLADTHSLQLSSRTQLIVAQLGSAQVKAIAIGSPAKDELAKATGPLDKAVNEAGPALRKQEEEAKELSKETNDSNHQHLLFELAEVGLQIGIVLASVSIIARRRWLLGGGGLAGTAGVALLVAGFLA